MRRLLFFFSALLISITYPPGGPGVTQFTAYVIRRKRFTIHNPVAELYVCRDLKISATCVSTNEDVSEIIRARAVYVRTRPHVPPRQPAE